MAPILVDASPLIYLAKLEALECFAPAGWEPLVPPAVVAETASAAIAYRFPDALTISGALASGVLGTVDLTGPEQQEADRLAESIKGLGRGECEALAVAGARGSQVVIFERQGRRIARALGIAAVDPVEVLFRGTRDRTLLRRRISHFADMTAMRATDVEALIARIDRRMER
jgi:predicted nucleic acid-binding protein